MESAVEQARALGLSGQEALAFVREQETFRAERAEERRLDREHESTDGSSQRQTTK